MFDLGRNLFYFVTSFYLEVAMSSLLRTRAVSVWLLAGFLALGAGALSASAAVDASGVEGA